MSFYKKTEKPTGLIIARDYGIRTRRINTALFTSPSRFAMGAVQLLTSDRIHDLLAVYASNNDLEVEKVAEEWGAGLRKRFKSTTLETISRREAIKNVVRYGSPESTSSPFSAEVVSKRGDGTWKVNLFPQSKNYSCGCPDYLSGPSKGVDLMCQHIATLAVAIAADRRLREGSGKNLTGLTAADFERTIALPFRLGDEVLSEMMVDYVALSRPYREVNAKILANSRVYSPLLKKQIAAGEAQFSVLAQEQEKKEQASLTRAEADHYGAVRALVGRLRDHYRDQSAWYEGHSRVFAEGDFEAVALRHRRGNVVYETVVPQDGAPFVVFKKLGKFSPHWLDVADKNPIHPLRRTVYDGIDDATRREAVIEIFRPDFGLGIPVPSILRERYDALTK